MSDEQIPGEKPEVDIPAFIAKAYAALPIVMPGFKPREQQKLMIRRASALFAKKTVGLVEAPTGTGKSMGYLIPGIVTAAIKDRVLIISTATASLQDQLAAHDIPAAMQAISSVVHDGTRIQGETVVVAKGRERYACPVRLDEAAHGSTDLFADGSQNEKSEQIVRLYKSLDSGEWDGVRDSLDEGLPAAQWRTIANNALTCTGRQCPKYEECPYYKVQENLKKARVIITNHDYLLTCLSRLPQSKLKDPEAIYVFDEGHHLGDKLINSFARTLDFSGSWEEDISSAMSMSGPERDQIDFAHIRVKGTWKACAQSIASMLGGERTHRFVLGEAPRHFVDLLKTLNGDIAELKEWISKSRDRVRKSEADIRRQGLVSLSETIFGKVLNNIEEAEQTIYEFTSDMRAARWLERGRTSLEIRCSPFDPAEKARKHLWPIVKTALLTSATIAPLGGFEQTINSLGLPSETPTLKLSTPFNYAEQAKIYVPRLALDGNDPGHGRRVSAYLKELSNEHHGVLVYFTSRKLMQDCYDAMPESQKKDVLLQGMWQPSSLLLEHRKRIDAGQRSIIFGLDSVGEGVDLPGVYCTQVVVTKLPFPTQDDPVLTTHGEYLKEKGKDPFSLLTLPVAGRKFAQICGRLMRRESDYGEIMVLDRRLISKRYGRRLVAGTQFSQLAAD